jgi:hypothetical protein
MFLIFFFLPSLHERPRTCRQQRIRRCSPLTVKWCCCATTSSRQRRSTPGDRGSMCRDLQDPPMAPWRAGPALKGAGCAATLVRGRQQAHLAVLSHRPAAPWKSFCVSRKKKPRRYFPVTTHLGPFFGIASHIV